MPLQNYSCHKAQGFRVPLVIEWCVLKRPQTLDVNSIDLIIKMIFQLHIILGVWDTLNKTILS